MTRSPSRATAGTPADRRSVVYLPPWRIDVTSRAGVPRLVSAAELARLASRTLARAGAPGPASMALFLSDDDELASLNRSVMRLRGPTDVLSFPLLAVEAFPPHPGQDRTGAAHRPKPPRFVLPPGARPHLGDVVISVERAVAQAHEGRGGQASDRRWGSRDELRLLAVHGTLHLCGWDHADPNEGEAMRALEREVLEAGAASRPRRAKLP